ncbi:hypothetical protein GCM10020256_55200 [Streptomyces thermocoprophilus]
MNNETARTPKGARGTARTPPTGPQVEMMAPPNKGARGTAHKGVTGTPVAKRGRGELRAKGTPRGKGAAGNCAGP